MRCFLRAFLSRLRARFASFFRRFFSRRAAASFSSCGPFIGSLSPPPDFEEEEDEDEDADDDEDTEDRESTLVERGGRAGWGILDGPGVLGPKT